MLENYPIAFNGGKESIVVLDLLLKAGKSPVLLYTLDNDFQEVTDFVIETAKKYKLQLHILTSLNSLVAFSKHNFGNYIFTGRRKDDGEKDIITNCNWKGLEDVVLVNLLYAWDYHDVWRYILDSNLEYPELYKQGYSSLGRIDNTFPNYFLAGKKGYRPAWKLEDSSQEKAGRIKARLPLTLNSKVERGNRLGSTINFPTANFSCTKSLTHGVYSGKTFVKGKEYSSLTSVGYSLENNKATIETHILDFEYRELYDEDITVVLNNYLRPMFPIKDLDELKNIIKKDIKLSKISSYIDYNYCTKY